MSKLIQVNKRQLAWALEDGSYDRRPVSLWLDRTGTPTFVYKLPEHVWKSLGVEPEIRSEVQGDAEAAWDKTIGRFIEWYRTAKAEPVIILEVAYYGETEDGDRIEDNSFFYTSHGHERFEAENCIGIRYRLAFRVNGRVHYRERKWDGKTETIKVGTPERDEDRIVLDYSDELKARLDVICGAVNRAANQLHEIVTSKDVAKLLMSSKVPLLSSPKGSEK